MTATFKSAAEAPAGDALEQAWRDVITAKAWITRQVFEESVQETLQTPCEFLPTPGQFVEVCRVVKDDLERDDDALALPPPQRVVAPAGAAVDPDDPYSCTPEERERWAREDAWIRKWVTTLERDCFPDVLERMSAEDRERTLSLERANRNIANWPNLTPVQRRAKERRAAGQMERAQGGVTK